MSPDVPPRGTPSLSDDYYSGAFTPNIPKEDFMSLLLIVLLVLLLAGGGFGYNRYGAVGGSGIVGTILLVILFLWLLGALGTRV